GSKTKLHTKNKTPRCHTRRSPYERVIASPPLRECHSLFSLALYPCSQKNSLQGKVAAHVGVVLDERDSCGCENFLVTGTWRDDVFGTAVRNAFHLIN